MTMFEAWNEVFRLADEAARSNPWPLRIRMAMSTFARFREVLWEQEEREEIRWTSDGWLEYQSPALTGIPVVVDDSVTDGEIEVDLPYGLTVPC